MDVILNKSIIYSQYLWHHYWELTFKLYLINFGKKWWIKGEGNLKFIPDLSDTFHMNLLKGYSPFIHIQFNAFVSQCLQCVCWILVTQKASPHILCKGGQRGHLGPHWYNPTHLWMQDGKYRKIKGNEMRLNRKFVGEDSIGEISEQMRRIQCLLGIHTILDQFWCQCCMVIKKF